MADALRRAGFDALQSAVILSHMFAITLFGMADWGNSSSTSNSLINDLELHPMAASLSASPTEK